MGMTFTSPIVNGKNCSADIEELLCGQFVNRTKKHTDWQRDGFMEGHSTKKENEK
jgi:hypothetical protein